MKRAILAFLMLALTGCSQVESLAPVGGDHISMVRFAANDILVAAKIDILTAPVCTEEGEVSSCAGATMTGDKIGVESTGDRLKVVVGDRTLYDGSLASVISENAQQQ